MCTHIFPAGKNMTNKNNVKSVLQKSLFFFFFGNHFLNEIKYFLQEAFPCILWTQADPGTRHFCIFLVILPFHSPDLMLYEARSILPSYNAPMLYIFMTS